MLLSIALFPLLAPEFWHHHFGKISAFWAAALGIPFLIVFKGMLCGVANIIPGVSGGTFALILGIYERLIAALGALGLQTLKAFYLFLKPPKGMQRRQIMQAEAHRTDAWFLAWLGVGVLLAVIASARLIAFLLDQHREPTLGFFIGLILPSLLVPYRLLEQKGIRLD